MSRIKRLIREVHERSLWQALVVYLGASFAVLEAVDLFIGYFGLPAWLFGVAFTLLVVGLPFLILSSLAAREEYADDVPPEVAEEAAEEDRRLRLLTWRNAAASFVVALAVWGVVVTGWLVFAGSAQPSRDRKMLVVLPFDNLGALEDEYFSDGLTDAVNARLGVIHGLGVISRQSAMQYKSSDKSAGEIGEELGVEYIL
jgi:hypothetical protein